MNLLNKNQNHRKQIVSKFLKDLYEMLDDNNSKHVIEWTDNGFQINDLIMFKQRILQAYFKHNNFTSFLRQLNKYGFILRRKTDEIMQYTHNTIRKNNRQYLKEQQIKENNNSINESWNYQKEIKTLQDELIQMYNGQNVLVKQMQLSVQIMSQLQQKYGNLCQTAINTVGYAHNLTSTITSNYKKVGFEVSGEILNMQLNAFHKGFPEFFESTYITPLQSTISTPIPFLFQINENEEQQIN